jgi:hypothetical protein
MEPGKLTFRMHTQPAAIQDLVVSLSVQMTTKRAAEKVDRRGRESKAG